LTRKEERTLAQLRALENRLDFLQTRQAEERVFQQSQADKIAHADKARNTVLEENRKMVRDTRVQGAINRVATFERNQRAVRSGHQEKAENRERQNAWLADLARRNAGLKATVMETHAMALQNIERLQAERLDAYCTDAAAKTARFREKTAHLRTTQDGLLSEEAERLSRLEHLTARCFSTSEELADRQKLSKETKDLLAQTQSWSQTSRSWAKSQSLSFSPEKSQMVAASGL
jgi:uncharacterized protein (DUF885 family)